MMTVHKVLAMDTVFAQGSVALLDGERLVAQSWFDGPEGHVALLPQEVARLLAEAGWRGQDVDLLAATVGPGSFSGSRIALGFAKGFAAAVGVPVIGVSTLDVLVAGVPPGAGCKPQRVAVLLDARRQEVYAALYEIDLFGQTTPLLAPAAWNPSLLADQLAKEWSALDQTILLLGDGLIPYAAVFQQALGAGCALAEPGLWRLDTRVLGLIAQRRLGHQDELAAELLEPLYLRPSDAKEQGIRIPAEP